MHEIDEATDPKFEDKTHIIKLDQSSVVYSPAGDWHE
jgi:hypothetical protein